jgi:SAM-dependent methyltransferase
VLTDNTNLEMLRLFTIEKSKSLDLTSSDNVLEIGPPRLKDALNSPVYQDHPEWFIDLQKKCMDLGANYSSLDLDTGVNPTYLGSLEDTSLSLPSNHFTSVICFSILEHCQDLVAAVKNISNCLAPGFDAHFLTPWDLRFHGPRPDCWRISDDGYRWLLRDNFNIVEIEYLNQESRELSPIAIYVHAKKKS